MDPAHDMELPLIGSDHVAIADAWQTNSVGVDEVNRRLNALWQRLEVPKPRRLGKIVEPNDETDVPGMFARTNTYNLLVCARTASRAARSADIVSGTGSNFPTRVVALYSDPMLDRRSPAELPDGGGLTVRVALPRAETPSRRQEHFESVAIIGGPRAIGSAASTAFPLCVPDLSTVLWWNGDIQYDLGVFRDLVGGSDQVVYDSALFGDVYRSLAELEPIVGQISRRQGASTDLTWLRTAIWRGLVAQFFDVPPTPDAVHTISDVTMTYDPTGSAEGMPSGQSAALLLLGWLSSRLGWRIADRPTRTSNGLRFDLEAPVYQQGVVVHLRPQEGDATPTGIRRVEISTGGPAHGHYVVEQVDAFHLMTTSDVKGGPGLSRHVMMLPVGDQVLLREAFSVGGQDVVAESALSAVAGILEYQHANQRVGSTMEGRR
ncbi:MAG TPA: glucose-6-phosphate dehydrogenase assembly protein OpcA [Thermomicrobiales bacterium]|jgi:hypothetical protein|nr:glucose-6-phosphate dehydrogenase assembly protein OpcA [Thermomicrobiales bacterium]